MKPLLLLIAISLSGCSMLDTALEKSAVAMVGSGSAATGMMTGYAIGGPVGGMTGALIGAGSGAVLAEQEVADQPEPTFMELLEQLLEITGWGIFAIFILPWLIGLYHDKPTFKRKENIDERTRDSSTDTQ